MDAEVEEKEGASQAPPSPAIAEIPREEEKTSPVEIATSSRTCRVIAVTSGKGGVGKTMVALNMAVDLGQRGKRVLLVDADLGFANVNILAGIENRNDLLSILENQKPLRSILQVGPGGIHIMPGGSGVFKLSNMPRAHRNYFIEQLSLLKQEFDVMIVDTGAGFSQNHLKLVMFSDQVFLVSTPELTALADVYAAIKVIHARKVSQEIGIIVNMTESLSEANFVFDRLSTVAKTFLNLPLQKVGFIAKDGKSIQQSIQKRMPMLLLFPESRFSKCISLINEKVFGEEEHSDVLEAPPLSWKDTLFGRMVESFGTLKKGLQEDVTPIP